MTNLSPRFNSLIETITSELTQIGFGERDGKGRELGIDVHTTTIAASVGPLVHRTFAHGGKLLNAYTYSDAELSYYPMGLTLDRAPGVYYTAACQATRDGKAFGAIQSWNVFATEAERDAFVARRVEGSRKRAPKAATTGRAARR